MSRRPIARVHLQELPDVPTGALGIEVACDGSRTDITYMLRSGDPDVPALVAFTLCLHRRRCPAACDLRAVYAEGGPGLRDYIDRLDAVSQTGLIRSYAGDRST